MPTCRQAPGDIALARRVLCRAVSRSDAADSASPAIAAHLGHAAQRNVTIMNLSVFLLEA